MSIITLAQTKGGAGKTTTAQILVAELVHRGLTVAAIDLDPNKVMSRFVTRSSVLEEVKIATLNNDDRVSDLIIDLSKRYQAVIIDLMGAATPDMMVAIGFSDLVIVPSQVSEADVRCGIETWRMIQEVERLGRREIAKAVLFTRTPPAIRTRAQEHVRRQYEKSGIPIMKTEFMERVAFKEMGFSGLPPNMTDRTGNAARNVIAICDEIFELLPRENRSEPWNKATSVEALQ
jgi:chromosome partitioning protein